MLGLPSPTISGAYFGPRNPGPNAAGLRKRYGAILTKLGNSASSAPSSWLQTEPSVGYWTGPCGRYPVRRRYVARVWSPSLVVIERMTAQCSICFASFGRCSEISIPGTDVSIALYGPPFSCPGLRSKVSIWLGPPDIHSRMHERRRSLLAATSSANAGSQRDIDTPKAPQAESLSQSRRERDA